MAFNDPDRAAPSTPSTPARPSSGGSTLEVVGLAPAVATANLMLVTSQALAIAALANAREQEASMTEGRAVTTRCVRLLLGLDPASAARADAAAVFR